MKMFPRPHHLPGLLRLLVSLALLAAVPARAVQLVVWDTQLQTKLGYGETVGNKLNLQLVPDYSGPVIALFTRDETEKNSFPGLMSRYSGHLKGGVLTLEDASGPLPLTKFLAPFKLSPSLQNAVKTFSLPGLKTPVSTPASGNSAPGNSAPGSSAPGK